MPKFNFLLAMKGYNKTMPNYETQKNVVCNLFKLGKYFEKT